MKSMKSMKLWLFTFFIQLSLCSIAQAANFSWLEKLSVEAHLDPLGIKAKIATRFHLGEAKVKAVISNVGSHADAYMVLRLAEMSALPVDTVVKHYHAEKDKGWGVLAKRIGIKPGSREFHGLKNGHDLQTRRDNANAKRKYKGNNEGKGYDKGRGHSKGKGHNKGRGNNKGKRY